MVDPHRISPSLLLSLALALAPAAARGQEPAPTPPPATGQPATTQPAATPQESPAQPAPAAESLPADAVPVTPMAPLPAPAVPAAPGPGTPGAKTPGTQPPAPVPPNPDLLQFQLRFPAEKGGGAATGAAGSLEYKRDDYAVLTGEVHIHYQDMDVHADRAEIDLTSKDVIVLGNVIVDQGPRRLTGTSGTFNLGTKLGTLKQATGQVAPDYYFSGSEVSKVGDNTYTVTDGIFTSCSQKVPDWSFKIGTARVEVEGYAHVRSAAMRAKKLPVLYTPYILWPVKSERSSGFLVPNIGYSQRRGAELGLAYFQTLGRSYDTTFHVDLFEKNFLGLGDEFRYRPSEGTKGDFIGYLVRDRENLIPGDLTKGEWRWKLELNHETSTLPFGMRGVVHYMNFSDFNFFRDFENDFDRTSLRTIDSRASATGNWGANLVNLLLNDRQTFVGPGDEAVVQRKLPEIEYRLRSTRIGHSLFYLQLDSSASLLDIARPGSYNGQYGRFDLFPQITLPIRTFPWLSVALTGGERLTYYSDSLNATNAAFTGQAVTRTLPYGNAEIVGPSISRIFDWKVGKFGKFKHLIEPRFTYTYQGTFDDQQLIPQFDEIDPQFSANAGRVALDNRILAKPADGKGSAREVLLFEIARRYSFDNTQPLLGSLAPGAVSSQAGPLEGLLRFEPSETLSFKLEATYDTLYKGLASTGLSGNLGARTGDFVGVTWFTRYTPQTGDTVGDQVRVNGGLSFLKRRLRFEGQVNYDLQEQLLQQQRYIVNWTSQCYGIRLELRDFRTGTSPRISDKQFRFSLSLKNVGTFLDLSSRSSSAIQP